MRAVTTLLLAAALAPAPARPDPIVRTVGDLSRLTLVPQARRLLGWMTPVALVRIDRRGPPEPFDAHDLHRLLLSADGRLPGATVRLLLPLYTLQGALLPSFDVDGLRIGIGRILATPPGAGLPPGVAARTVLVDVTPSTAGHFRAREWVVLTHGDLTVHVARPWTIGHQGELGGRRQGLERAARLLAATAGDPRAVALARRAQARPLVDSRGRAVPGVWPGLLIDEAAGDTALHLTWDLPLHGEGVLVMGGTLRWSPQAPAPEVSDYALPLAELATTPFPEIERIRDHPLAREVARRRQGPGQIVAERHEGRWLVRVRAGPCCSAVFAVGRRVEVLSSRLDPGSGKR